MTEPWIGRLTDNDIEGGSLAVPAFQDHQRRNAKRTAEEYRWGRRGIESAGLMLFANCTWIKHVATHDPADWETMPVWESVKYAYEPVMVALETPQYHFKSGQKIETKLIVVNDDAQFRDFENLRLEARLLDARGEILATHEQEIGDVPYYAVRDYPFELTLPTIDTGGRNMPAEWVLHLLDGEGEQLSINRYPVFVADAGWMDGHAQSKPRLAHVGVSEEVATHLSRIADAVALEDLEGKAERIVVGSGAELKSLDGLRERLAPGGRILLLGLAERVQSLYPAAYRSEHIPAEELDAYPFIPGGMKEGARWTSDRNYRFVEVPEELEGKGYLLTRMDDKRFNTDHRNLLHFTLGAPATVYVGLDSRTKRCPGWITSQGFERTELKIKTSDPHSNLICFRKDFPATEVVLGGAMGSGAGAMYTVVVAGVDAVSNVRVMTPEETHKPETRTLKGEYVWMQGRAEFDTPLVEGLEWQDWKWWMAGTDAMSLACTAGHRLDLEQENLLPIGRYLGPHFYWRGSIRDNWLRSISWPVFALEEDWGEVLVSELAIDEALAYDPRAVRTLSNFVLQPLR